MKKRILSLAVALSMAAALFVVPQSAAFAADETAETTETTQLKVGDYVEMGTFGEKPMVYRIVAFQQILDNYTDTKVWDSTKPTYTRYANPTTKYDAPATIGFDDVGLSAEQKDGYYPLLLYCGTPDEVRAETGYGYNLTTGPYAPARDSDDNNVDSWRVIVGSSYWEDSSLKIWLNSDEDTVTYTTEHIKDVTPDSTAYGGDENAPAAGFLTNFSEPEKAAMVKDVTQRTVVSGKFIDISENGDYEEAIGGSKLFNDPTRITDTTNYNTTAYYQNTTDTVFVPDIPQIQTTYSHLNNIYKPTNSSTWLRCAIFDDELTLSYNGVRYPADGEETSADLPKMIRGLGLIGGTYPADPELGVRPAFFLEPSSLTDNSENVVAEAYGDSGNTWYTFRKDITDKAQISAEDQTYTGEALEPEITVTYMGEELTEGTDYTVEYSDNTGAGTAAATVTGIGRYTGTVAGSFAIGKADVDAPELENKEYTGETLTADVPENDRYYATTNAGGSDAGEYDVVLMLKDGANYKWSDSDDVRKVLTFSITKAENAWTEEPSIEDAAYGEEIVPKGKARFGDFSVTYAGADGTDYAESADPPTAAGSYTAAFTVEGTDNYTELSAEVAFAIGKTESRTTVGKSAVTYGETLTLTAEVAGVGALYSERSVSLMSAAADTVEFYLVEGENETLLGTAEVVYDDEDGKDKGTATLTVKTTDKKLAVGSNTIKAEYGGSVNLNGSESGGVTVTLERKAVTLAWTGAGTRGYDGNESEVKAIAAGVESGDEVIVTVTGGAETNAGTHTATAAGLTGADAGWYKLPENVTQSYTINKAGASAAAAPSAAERLVYNGEERALVSEGAASGGIMEYSLSETGGYSQTVPTATEAGDYTVWYKVTGDGNHYDSEPASVAVTIYRADGDAAVTMANYSCGETTVNPVPVSATNGTDGVTYRYKLAGDSDSAYSDAKPLTAGDYIVKASFAETKNYNAVTVTAAFTVSHTPVTDAAVEATCTETGLTEGSHCSGCGATLTAQTETPVDSNAHSYGDWTILVDPTQTTVGVARRICRNDSSHIDRAILPELTDTSVWTKGAYTAPTCTEKGFQVYTSEYGDVKVAFDATGHSYGAWEITVAPTETTTGAAKRVCEKDSSHIDSVTLPILTDTDVWSKGAYIAPTETANGSREYSSVYGTVRIIIPALGHTHVWGSWTIVIEPTETATGVARRVCEKDSSHIDSVTLPVLTDTDVWSEGEYIAPTETEDGSREYISEYGTVTVVIPALGHTHVWSDWTIVITPTLTAEGAARRVCAADNSHTETVILPVLTDTNVWSKGTYTAPTETEDGAQEYASVYGTVRVTIPALGHTHIWGAWVIVIEPTETKTGVAQRVCESDGSHIDGVTLPVLTDESVWSKGAYIAPTEAEDGSQEYISEYGTVTVIIPALGFSEYKVTLEADGSVKATAPEAGTYSVIFAAYKDGVLTGVATADAVFDAAGEIPVAVPESFNADGADTVKAMLWSAVGDMLPLCGAASR